MNKLNALNDDGAQEIICGRTEVIVKKRTVADNGHEKIETIHKGIVLQETAGGFLRVYNPMPGGDAAPEHSGWYPRQSRLCWCEITHVREEHRAMPIPPLLRY
jgi:hypothetical protein